MIAILVIVKSILSILVGFLFLQGHKILIQLILKKYFRRERPFISIEEAKFYDQGIREEHKRITRVYFAGKFFSFLIIMTIISFFSVRIFVSTGIILILSLCLKYGTMAFLSQKDCQQTYMKFFFKELSVMSRIFMIFWTSLIVVLMINLIIYIALF